MSREPNLEPTSDPREGLRLRWKKNPQGFTAHVNELCFIRVTSQTAPGATVTVKVNGRKIPLLQHHRDLHRAMKDAEETVLRMAEDVTTYVRTGKAPE